MPSRYSPWLDRAGRLSPLKLAVFVLVLAPGVWIAARWSLSLLGPKPVTQAIHETGDWAVRLLLATLLGYAALSLYLVLVLPGRLLGLW